MAGVEDGEDDFPCELNEKLPRFHQSLEEIENVLQPLFATSVSESREKFQPLDRAKFDLVAAYALNSLFWIYLSVNGEDPQEHGIKGELERIRGYMSRVKEMLDKAKAPRLNLPAAKRFLASSLWTPNATKDAENDDKQSTPIDVDDQDVVASVNDSQKPYKKRKRNKKH